MRTCAAIWIAISLASPLQAEGCEDVSFEGASYTICMADPAAETIRVHLNSAEGTLLGSFGNLEAELGEAPLWAMNAGMYHDDRRPVGLYIEDGKELAPIVTREGPGNFGLLPNGVLCLSADMARIYESRRFAREEPDCTYATQSGPMLVIDGALHPRFLKDSESLFRRNGVGITEDGKLVAAISNERVNFHSFARLFRDQLQTPNALFLDGNISRLQAPNLGREDVGFPMGPILSVTRRGG